MKITASECYKKLASISWPVLFTLNYFFLIHTLSSSAAVVIAAFLSKLDHRPLFNYIYYETILMRELVST